MILDLFKLIGTIAIDNKEAKKALQEVSDEGGKAESKLSKTFSAIGKGAAIAGKAIASGLAVGATACVGLATAAIKSYSEYEQLVGGVETLFGTRGAKSVEEYAKLVGKSVDSVSAEFGMLQQAQSDVMNNAANAYKTAGLSMNAYMETANGLAAALNQSSASQLESAALADQAIIDMSDNANKMGTSMEAIQNAYAGFSKANFTMLDNLKLGYGGTKEEMQRLLDDAGKIANTKFDISSFADITEAIHVMQVEMGIAGTTANEASTTIQGSLGMLKGAWSNLLVGLSDPTANITVLVQNVFDSVVTFADNLVPRLTQVLSGIATAFSQIAPMITAEIPNLLNQVLPALIEGAASLLNGVASALPSILGSITSVLPALLDGIMSVIDALLGALPGILQTLLSALTTILPQIIDAVVSIVMMLVEMLPDILQPIIDNLPTLILSIVEALVNNLPILIEGLVQLILGIVTALPQIIQALIDALPTIISTLVSGILGCLPELISGLVLLVVELCKALPQILKALHVELPKALRKGIFEGLGNAFSGLGEWFGKTFSGAKDWAVNAWSNAKEKFNSVKEKCAECFSNLKDKVGTKFNEAKTKAVEKWNDAKTKFNGVKDKVVSAFSNLKDKVSPLFSKAKENATQTWSTVKGAFEKIKNGDIVGAFSDLGSLLKGKFTTALNTAKKGFDKAKQIGKDLLTGLWNGINDKFGWLTGKIKGFAKNVTDKLKGFFGIKSPSRVFRDEIGKQLAEGVAVGIEENTHEAVAAMSSLGAETLKQAKANVSKMKDQTGKLGGEIVKVAKQKLDDWKLNNDLTAEAEAAFWDDIRKQITEGTKERLEADKKYYEAKDRIYSDFLSSAEKTLDTYKTYNEMTLADEAGFWDKIRQQVAEGTDARIEADKKYLEAKKRVNESILTAEEKLQTKLNGIVQKTVDRQNEIVGSFGLFDGFDAKNSQFDPSAGLIMGLHADIRTIEKWDETMGSLRSKIGDTALFEELQGMGVNELQNLMYVDQMTEEELAKYVSLYDRRSAAAQKMANDELGASITSETQQAFEEFAKECEKIGVDVSGSIETMRINATNSFALFTQAIVDGTKSLKDALSDFNNNMQLPNLSIETQLETGSGAVEWFASAMNSPKIMNQPTIFGYNSATGKYMGGGEAGSEVISGTNTLMKMIQSAVTEQNSAMVAYLHKIIEMLADFFPQLIDAFDIDLYVNGRVLAAELAPDMNDALGLISSRKDRGR